MRNLSEVLASAIMIGAKSQEAQIADGTAKMTADVGILQKLASTMVDFDPMLRDHARHQARLT